LSIGIVLKHRPQEIDPRERNGTSRFHKVVGRRKAAVPRVFVLSAVFVLKNDYVGVTRYDERAWRGRQERKKERKKRREKGAWDESSRRACARMKRRSERQRPTRARGYRLDLSLSLSLSLFIISPR
jgi:hypothetical protein